MRLPSVQNLVQLLEALLTEIRVERKRRVPVGLRMKRRRYYKKRKSKLKRRNKLYRRKARVKRMAKRRLKLRKRMRIKPGSRKRIRLSAGMNRMAKLFEVKNQQLGAFEVVDHGVEHEQYFPGAGTKQNWDMVYTGAGSSQKEALEDAIEQLAYDFEVSSELESEIQKAKEDVIHYGVTVRGDVKDKKLVEPSIDDSFDIQVGDQDALVSVDDKKAMATVFSPNPMDAAEEAADALAMEGLDVSELKALIDSDKAILDSSDHYYYVSIYASKDPGEEMKEESVNLADGFKKAAEIAESLKQGAAKIESKKVVVVEDPVKTLMNETSCLLESLDEDFEALLGVKKTPSKIEGIDDIIEDANKLLKAAKNGSLDEDDGHAILKKMTEFLHEAVEKTLSEAEEASEGEPVKHTIKLEVGLGQIAKDLGYDDWAKMNDYLDADSYDDVYHDGYSAKDAQNWNLPAGVDHDAANIFPSAVAMAMEAAERDGYVAAIGQARRDAIVQALEKIQVVGEYMTSDGEMISVGDAGIKSAHIDGDKVVVEIENPEHLINDLMHGDGRFYPEFSPYEKAPPEELKKYLHYLGRYFSIYGDRKPDGELDSRFSPDIDDSFFKEELEFRVSEMSLEEIADAVMDAVEEERFESESDAIEAAARISGKPKKEIAKAVKDHLVHKSNKAKEKADAIKDESQKTEAKLTEQFSEDKKVKNHDVVVFDNGGKTMDRYTVLVRAKKGWDIYTMSPNATSPQGVNQYSHSEQNYEPKADETRIPLDKLPAEVLKAIKDRAISESKKRKATMMVESNGVRKIMLGEAVLKTLKTENLDGISDEERAKIVSDLAASLGEEFKEEIEGSLDLKSGRYSSWGDSGSFKADGQEYNFIIDEDEAERIATDMVKQDLENEPEMFNQDFLSEYIYISDIDKRIFAGEEADARIESMSDEDIISEAGAEEEYAAMENLEAVKGELEELESKYGDEEISEDEYNEQKAKLESQIAEYENAKTPEEVLNDAKDELQSLYSDEIEKKLKQDPIGYFVDDLGIYSREELMKQRWINIDVADAANAAVAADGWAHFLSLYSGDYETTASGIVYFRE